MRYLRKRASATPNWRLGYVETCEAKIDVWSRLFALVAIAFFGFTVLGMALLIAPDQTRSENSEASAIRIAEASRPFRARFPVR
jgi:hypothetical protein